MAQQALPPGATRRRAAFGLLDANGWTWAGLIAGFWFLFIILMLGVVPNWAYYFTTSSTIHVGYNFASIVNLCPADNEDLPCPAPVGAVKPWQTSPEELAMPAARSGSTVYQSGSTVYLIGGAVDDVATAEVLVTEVTEEGNLVAWTSGPALPEPRTDAAVGLFGGIPGAGATMGTVVAIQSGARSALAGLVRVAILIIVVLWAADLTAVIPLAVLAGIALKVGINIIDWGFLKRAHRISPKGSVVTYSVILLTVFVDLIVAVGIGLFVANVMTVMRLSELQAADVKAVRDAAERLGYSHMDIVSGAGHDACWINQVAPTAMVMCPCVDGLSHNEAEAISKEWAAAGTDVLMHAVVETAEIVE